MIESGDRQIVSRPNDAGILFEDARDDIGIEQVSKASW